MLQFCNILSIGKQSCAFGNVDLQFIYSVHYVRDHVSDKHT